MDLSPLAPELVLCGGALLLLLLDPFVDALRRGVSATASLVFLAIGAFLLIANPSSDAPQLAGTILTDALMRGFGLVALLVAGLTVLASRGYAGSRLSSLQSEYYVLLLFATTGMLLLISSNHLVTIFVSLELMSVSSFALAGLERSRRSSEGGMKFFLLGALSSAVLLFGIALVYGLTGSLTLPEVGKVLNQATVPPAAFVALVLIVAGFGFKLSLVPFHMWCPDAYEGAPTPVAGFLSVGSKGAALLAMWRVLTVGFAGMAPEWERLLWLLAIASMILGNFAAIQQTNLKRMLAYSTIAHAGYLLVGFLAYSELGTAGLFFYLASYAFMSVGAFAAVAYLDHLGLGEEWGDLAGLSRKHPFLSFAFAVFLLSLAGVPPLAGFAGKFVLFAAAVEQRHYGLVVVAVLASVVSFYYYVRVMKYMYVVPPAELPTAATRPTAKPLGSDWGLTGVLMVAVIGTIAFGVWPQPFLAFFLGTVAPHFH